MKHGDSIVQLTTPELEKVQEIWITIQKKIQMSSRDSYARNRILLRLYELFKDEIKDLTNVY